MWRKDWPSGHDWGGKGWEEEEEKEEEERGRTRVSRGGVGHRQGLEVTGGIEKVKRKQMSVLDMGQTGCE